MINVAIDAAQKGGQLALSYFTKVKNVSYKADNSPVTIADQNTEKLIRKIISKKFPGHGIIGEEFPPVNPKSEYQWVIDPIDGTKQFIRGIPFWATLLALLENGKPILGVAYMPTSNEVFSAQKGKGTYLGGKRMYVSKVSSIEKAYLSFGSIIPFKTKGKFDGFIKICNNVQSHRGYGDTIQYMMLIKGQEDIVLEAKDQIHDIAAPAILVEEAGGKFTNFAGEFSLTSGEAVATNGLLHDQVLKLLNS